MTAVFGVNSDQGGRPTLTVASLPALSPCMHNLVLRGSAECNMYYRHHTHSQSPRLMLPIYPVTDPQV